ncbi:G protein-regulated inducer of neurite outgrowth 2 isoform X1 [Aquarana catesbeiana]|uniref:G protein-regulated inducer of neurite outgrowth 2 isoform X1 n=2 Tax=Aquarana catesbeiana TaxID=8400 RepID=UPI003CC99987
MWRNLIVWSKITLFIMTNNIHNLSTHSCQEELNLMYIEKTIPGSYSLSKSSSLLPCSSLEGSQTKPEMHKSLNSIRCVPKCNENSIQHSHSSNLSSTQDSAVDQCSMKTSCNHLSVDKAEEKMQQKNHYLSADSSLAATEPEITRSFVRYNVSENISLLGRSEMSMYEAESLEKLDTPNTIVQKSYSDYCCGRRSSVPHSVKVHNKISATYSNLSSSGSISGSDSDRTCNLSNVTQDSGIVHSSSNIQNNLTDATSPDRDHNIPLCHLDSSSIQHNITVYAVPGTYQHGILGPRNSGNGFPNNGHVYSQSHHNIPGVMSCDNISETKLYPEAMIFHNSCSVHCCRSHEPMIKADDTVAYCHSMPIPSVQLSTGLGHSFGDPSSLNTQSQVCSHLTLSDKIAFPKLVSSVSESGLDARKLIRCGQLTFPQALVSIEELHLNSSVKGNNEFLLKTMDNSQDGLEFNLGAKMKDNWTMTSMNYLSPEQRLPLSCKDAEVQTIIIMENKSVSTIPCLQTTGHSHLHPEVGLGFNLQCPQTPVREVRWDDEGMTWEVYGAAVDPEVLGLAIQKHLEIQIEQHLQPSELSGEMEQPAKEKRRSFRTVIRSLRQSNCCVRTNSTSE